MTCQFFVMLDHFDHSILLQYHLCMLISTPYLCIYIIYIKNQSTSKYFQIYVNDTPWITSSASVSRVRAARKAWSVAAPRLIGYMWCLQNWDPIYIYIYMLMLFVSKPFILTLMSNSYTWDGPHYNIHNDKHTQPCYHHTIPPWSTRLI